MEAEASSLGAVRPTKGAMILDSGDGLAGVQLEAGGAATEAKNAQPLAGEHDAPEHAV